MALIGNLKELNLVSLIQLNCMEKKTAKLTFNYRGKIGVIYFENGEIPHAQFDNFTGPDAIFRAIHLSEGEFKIEDGIRTNIKTNETRWSELILEGLRIYDESQVGQDQAHAVLVKNLMQIDGVLAAIILLKDGTPMAHSSFEEVDLYSAILALTTSKLQNVGKTSGIGYLHHVIVSFSDKTLMVYDRDPNIIGVFLGPQANLKNAEGLIQKELQNFANEHI